MKKKAIIVGAGINGLCLAEALNEGGYEVSVFDSADIPNLGAPSMLATQIMRPQYVEQMGLGMRIQPALSAWRKLFQKLGENYFRPEGVIAISQEEGDWADRALNVMRKQSLPFRYVHASVLRDMMPGLHFDKARFGVLADLGGVMRSRDLVLRLVQYLEEKRVEFHPREAVERVDAQRGAVVTKEGRYEADWVLVTGGAEVLMEEFEGQLSDFSGCVAAYNIPPEYATLWRFCPVWVDLGGRADCWGVPMNFERCLRLGVGSMSEATDWDAQKAEAHFAEFYEKHIKNFGRYSMQSFERIAYHGYASGDLTLKRNKQVVGLAADSGHGFKFAAENALSIAQALENDTISFAARHIAGA